MLFKQTLSQSIAKRILISFFLFSFIITAISIAVILYSQYSQEKSEIINKTQSHISSRTDFISEVVWNIDTSLATSSIKSLAKDPNILYIAIHDEKNNIFTEFGDKQKVYLKSLNIPLNHKSPHNNKAANIGTLTAHISAVTAKQHVKNNFYNIVLVQSLKSIITSFVFLYLIYNILVKHINQITNSLLNKSIDPRNRKNAISLNRTFKKDELQFLTDTLNANQESINEHIVLLKREKIKLTQEIKTRRIAEDKVSNAHQELLYVLNSFTSAIFSCKSDGEVVLMNYNALKLLSHHDSMLAGEKQPLYLDKIIKFKKEHDTLSKSINLKVHANKSKFITSIDAYYMSNNGHELLTPVELTIIPAQQKHTLLESNMIIVVNDKSKEAQIEEMNYLVSHDYLTKLYNRMYICKKIEDILARKNGVYSIAILDLDGFKEVNDSCGHHAGDQLLQLIAKTIPKSLNQKDILARIGGDEFTILFNSNTKESQKKALKIISDIEQLNFTYLGKSISVSCSIGITDIRNSDQTVETVMSRADKACYQVKSSSKGSAKIFQTEIIEIKTKEFY